MKWLRRVLNMHEEMNPISLDANGWPASEPSSDLDRDNLRAYFAGEHPRRWDRIRMDHLWMQRELERLGLNPEDARYLL